MSTIGDGRSPLGKGVAMNTANPVNAAYNSITARIPNALGFGIGILLGLALVIGGAATGQAKVIPLGVWDIAACIIAWADGARSMPGADTKTIKVTVTRVRALAWGIIALLLAVAIVVTIVI